MTRSTLVIRHAEDAGFVAPASAGSSRYPSLPPEGGTTNIHQHQRDKPLAIAGSKSQQFTILGIDTIFNFYKPKPPLSKFVDSFWLYEGHEPEHKTERILPTGTLELAINLRQNELRFYDAERPENCSRFSGAIVSGASGRGFTPAAEVFIIGIHFKPGGAFPFL